MLLASLGLMSVLDLVETSSLVVLLRLQLLQLVGLQTGGPLLTSVSLQAFALTTELLRSIVMLPLSRSGQHAGSTLLTGLPLLLPSAVLDAW